MAIYNEILSARYARAIQKLFSMKGEVPVKQLAGEIMAIQPLFSGQENRYLESWYRFGMTVYTTAVAAQNNVFQIRNPGPASIVVVVEKMTITTSLADTVEVRIVATSADLTNPISTTRLDARIKGTSAMAIASWANNVAAGGSVIDHVAQVANISTPIIFFEDQEITILAGDAIQVASIGVNEILRVSYQWRERTLEESERT